MTETHHGPISKRIVLINAISGVLTRVLTVGVFAWAIQYLIKRIPEEELALLPIMGSIALVLPLLQAVLTGGLARHVTEAYTRGDLDGVRRIVSSQFPLLLAGSSVLMLSGVLASWRIDHLVKISPALVSSVQIMLLMIVGQVAITTALAPFSTGLFARQKFVLQNCVDIGSSLVRIGLMLALMLGMGPKVEWVITAQVAAALVGEISKAVISMRMLPALRFHPTSFDWGTCKWVLSFSTWTFVADTANLIRRAADAPILNRFSTPVAVNDFFLGSLFETQLRQLTMTASAPLLPALTAMHALKQDRRLAAVYLRGGRIALWASMFLAVPLAVFAYDLFALFLGDKYADHVDAGTVMILLLLAFPLTYPSVMFSRIAYAKGNIRLFAVRSLGIQIGNLVLTLLLVGVWNWGAIGSAAATLTSMAIGYPCLLWPLALRTLGLSWRKFFTESLLPGLLPAAIAAGVGFVTAQLIASDVLRVVVGVAVCLVAYVIAAAMVLKPVDRADLARIRRMVRV